MDFIYRKCLKINIAGVSYIIKTFMDEGDDGGVDTFLRLKCSSSESVS